MTSGKLRTAPAWCGLHGGACMPCVCLQSFTAWQATLIAQQRLKLAHYQLREGAQHNLYGRADAAQ